MTASFCQHPTSPALPAHMVAFPARMLLGAGWDCWHEMEVLGVEPSPGPAFRCGFVGGKAQGNVLCSQRGPGHLHLRSPSPAAELSHGSTTGACKHLPTGTSFSHGPKRLLRCSCLLWTSSSCRCCYLICQHQFPS